MVAAWVDHLVHSPNRTAIHALQLFILFVIALVSKETQFYEAKNESGKS